MERRVLRGLVAAVVRLCAPLVLTACASSSAMGVPQAGLAAPASAEEGSDPTVRAPESLGTAGAAFAVEDFFPDQLLDGRCGPRMGNRPLPDLSERGESEEGGGPPDLDCYRVERPQWPAPAGRSAWFYLANLRNFLVENRTALASHSLSNLVQSSGLLGVEENGFALYSLMALAMAKQEAGCAMQAGLLAYHRGVYIAWDDTMGLLNRVSALPAQCTQPEIARMVAQARPPTREVPVPREEAAHRFALRYFPAALLDGRCLAPTGMSAAMQDLADLNRPFPMSAPPDLDCYRTSRFEWPAPPGRSPWFYLGNFLGFLNSVEGNLSGHSLEELLSSSRITDQADNGYMFFVVMRILEAKGEIGCALTFARLAYRRGAIEAHGEANEILFRNSHQRLEDCQNETLRSLIASQGVVDA